jgi:pheromone a factor receptor
MALAAVDILCTVPISSYFVYINTLSMQPWISWEDTHYNFSNIDQFPSIIWRAIPAQEIGMELARWIPVLGAMLFFAFFGFTQEAKSHYKMAFVASKGLLRIRSGKSTFVLYYSLSIVLKAT